MVYLGKMEKKYKVLEEYINEVKKEKSMERKKYKVEKSLPINIGLLVGHIYDESYFKYLDIARIIKEEYIKEVKEDKPMETKCEDCKYWNIPEKCYDLNCSVHNHRAFAIEDKPMEQKKYRLKKDLPDCKVGEIFVKSNVNDSYWSKRQYHEISGYNKKFVENNPEWFEEVKEWGKLESILTDFALRIQGGYGNPDYNFLDDVCEISNKISELQKEIK